MHAPERWGRVQFTRLPPGQGTFKLDPTAAAHDVLMEVYYRQHVFHDQHKRYAATLAELGYSPANEPGIVTGSLRTEPSASGFVATATAKLPDGSTVKLHTREDSLLWSDNAAASINSATGR